MIFIYFSSKKFKILKKITVNEKKIRTILSKKNNSISESLILIPCLFVTQHCLVIIHLSSKARNSLELSF